MHMHSALSKTINLLLLGGGVLILSSLLSPPRQMVSPQDQACNYNEVSDALMAYLLSDTAELNDRAGADPKYAGFSVSLGQCVSQLSGAKRDTAEAWQHYFQGVVTRMRAEALQDTDTLEAARQLGLALTHLTDADGVVADLPYVLNEMGVVYAIQGNYSAALTAYQDSERFAPDWAIPFSNQANALLERDTLSTTIASARELYRRAIDLQASYAPAYLGLGNVLLRDTSTLTVALDNLRQAYSLLGEDPVIRYGFARGLVRRRYEVDSTQAINLLRRNVATGDRLGRRNTHYALGYYLEDIHPDSAVDQFQKALTYQAKKSRREATYRQLGKSYGKKQVLRGQGRQYFRSLIQSDPSPTIYATFIYLDGPGWRGMLNSSNDLDSLLDIVDELIQLGDAAKGATVAEYIVRRNNFKSEVAAWLKYITVSADNKVGPEKLCELITDSSRNNRLSQEDYRCLLCELGDQLDPTTLASIRAIDDCSNLDWNGQCCSTPSRITLPR